MCTSNSLIQLQWLLRPPLSTHSQFRTSQWVACVVASDQGHKDGEWDGAGFKPPTPLVTSLVCWKNITRHHLKKVKVWLVHSQWEDRQTVPVDSTYSTYTEYVICICLLFSVWLEPLKRFFMDLIEFLILMTDTGSYLNSWSSATYFNFNFVGLQTEPLLTSVKGLVRPISVQLLFVPGNK